MSETETNAVPQEEVIPDDIKQAMTFAVNRNGKSFQFVPRKKQRTKEGVFYPCLNLEEIPFEDICLYYDVKITGSVEQINDNLLNRLCAKAAQDAQGMFNASFVGPEGDKVWDRERNIKLATDLSVVRETKEELEGKRSRLLKESLAISSKLEAVSETDPDFMNKFKTLASELKAKTKAMAAIALIIEQRAIQRAQNKAKKDNAGDQDDE